METIKNLNEWNVDSILEVKPKTVKEVVTTLLDDEWFDKMSTCGLTYGEINELEKYNK
jgi:membrane-associated HD superfamily phosphohydrolase